MYISSWYNNLSNKEQTLLIIILGPFLGIIIIYLAIDFAELIVHINTKIINYVFTFIDTI